jgi:hypothetical protein
MRPCVWPAADRRGKQEDAEQDEERRAEPIGVELGEPLTYEHRPDDHQQAAEQDGWADASVGPVLGPGVFEAPTGYAVDPGAADPGAVQAVIRNNDVTKTVATRFNISASTCQRGDRAVRRPVPIGPIGLAIWSRRPPEPPASMPRSGSLF